MANTDGCFTGGALAVLTTRRFVRDDPRGVVTVVATTARGASGSLDRWTRSPYSILLTSLRRFSFDLSYKQRRSSVTDQPMNLVEISLNEAQLQQALEKLRSEGADSVTVIGAVQRTVGVQTTGGFDVTSTSYHCMYGRQADVEAVQRAIEPGQ